MNPARLSRGVRVKRTIPVLRLALIAIGVVVASSASAETGLVFPRNQDAPLDEKYAFQWENPQSLADPLPWFGMDDGGVTYLWQYKPAADLSGYIATFFYSRGDGQFESPPGQYEMYYGCHPFPYPDPGSTSTGPHQWELAGLIDGQDELRVGNKLVGERQVVEDVWYTQAFVVSKDSRGYPTGKFYIDLPGTGNTDWIATTSISTTYGATTSHDMVLMFGAAPWTGPNPPFGIGWNERLSGTLRGLKIFDKALSEADILTEASGLDDDLAHSAGGAGMLWYSNVDPTPDGANPDPIGIRDKSGNGNHPQWYDDSYKPTLYRGPADVPGLGLAGGVLLGASLIGVSLLRLAKTG
jgi:hypothetical protein